MGWPSANDSVSDLYESSKAARIGAATLAFAPAPPGGCGRSASRRRVGGSRAQSRDRSCVCGLAIGRLEGVARQAAPSSSLTPGRAQMRRQPRSPGGRLLARFSTTTRPPATACAGRGTTGRDLPGRERPGVDRPIAAIDQHNENACPVARRAVRRANGMFLAARAESGEDRSRARRSRGRRADDVDGVGPVSGRRSGGPARREAAAPISHADDQHNCWEMRGRRRPSRAAGRRHLHGRHGAACDGDQASTGWAG